MKCPSCGKEIEEGKLLCEHCGEEIKIVPDFDIELEAQLNETINNMAEDITASDTDEDSDTDDLKESFRDYYPEHGLHGNGKKAVVIGAGVVAVVAIIAIVMAGVQNSRDNSYEYQYNRAIECAASDHYDEAIAYLERALALDSDHTDARFLLAKYYDKNGQQQSAISVLTELLQFDLDNEEEVYDLLLSIYQERKEYDKMGDLLKDCDSEAILAKYNEYAALAPSFNKEGGVYDELISITISGNTDGFVYYTIDGTTPTTNSLVYETPILLESGDYTLKAFFVNMYGISSDIVTKNYYISLSEPEEPVVSLESGTYDKPQFIEIYHNDDTKIFYTLDGSVPNSKSNRYTEPIEMPYGVSNFSIVAINEDGLASPIVKRTYQLYIQANFSPELATQVLVNNLWAKGYLADTEGHISNKLAMNQYRVDTAVEIDGIIYYIVYEEYVDTTGRVHDASNLYAINADTAELFKAWKIGEGKYNLRALEE